MQPQQDNLGGLWSFQLDPYTAKGISADVLAKECDAARNIQRRVRGWLRRRFASTGKGTLGICIKGATGSCGLALPVSIGDQDGTMHSVDQHGGPHLIRGAVRSCKLAVPVVNHDQDVLVNIVNEDPFSKRVVDAT
eukprot:227668-Karenia_brevis.AAC.1